MRIIVLGAGHVGHAVVEALHEEHHVTVIDVDGDRIAALSGRYDIRGVEGDATHEARRPPGGREEADLFIGCSPREEANLICAMLVKRLSRAQTIIRTSTSAYLDAWRERELDIDFMVSPELETANAIAALLGLPAARHTDVFADGKVQLVEFDVPPDVPAGTLIGCALREAEIPEQSKVVGLIRGDRMIVPSGDAQILPGDRVVVIAAPDSARTWCRVAAEGAEQVDDVVIFGAGRMGTTIARVLLERDLRVRLVDAQRERVREAAETLPGVRAFHAHAFDADFLDRERIGRATAAVFASTTTRRTSSAHPRQEPRRPADDRAGPRSRRHRRLRARRRGRRDQPPPGDGRGDGPVRPRPPHPADRDARGRPLRDPRPHRAPDSPARRQARSATCPPRDRSSAR
jgi:trk system potassium uptake protein TrkA